MLDLKDLQPGECVPAHVNEENDELFVVLQGEVAFQCGDRSVVAASGSMIFAPKGMLRTWKAVGNTGAQILACAYGWPFELPSKSALN